MAGPTLDTILEAVRFAREQGDLRTATRALEAAYERITEPDSLDADLVASEGEALGRELAIRGASLAALGEWRRAQALGRDQAKNVRRILKNYTTWKPQVETVGVAKDGLTAGASGAFWVNRSQRGRVIVLQGGITGDGTEAFTRILDLSANQVDWLFVDMDRLTYVGSTGLAVVVKLAERLRNRGGGLSLFSLSTNLKLLVETLGLATFLNPVETLESSLELVS